MFSRKILLLMGAAAAVGWFGATPSAQSIVNEPVYFTFDGPVTVPGQTLPAGKYEFRIMNSQSDRQIIEIVDASGKKLGLFPAIAAARHDMPDKPEVRFHETPADMPQAVATWWYPATVRGHEFLYNKEQGTILAKLNKGGVAVEEGASGFTRISATEASAPPEPSAPAGQTQAPAAAAQAQDSTPRPVPPPPPTTAVEAPLMPSRSLSSPVPAATSASRVESTPQARQQLPRTAGSLTAVALVGLGSMLAGLTLLRRRIA